MGFTFDCTDIFYFTCKEDADAFQEQTGDRTERDGAHFCTDVPLYVRRHSTITVEVSSGGYGVPNLAEFYRNNVVCVHREVSSCQAQDINYQEVLEFDEFTYAKSDPYKGLSYDFEYTCPLNENDFLTEEAYDKCLAIWEKDRDIAIEEFSTDCTADAMSLVRSRQEYNETKSLTTK